MPNRKGRHTAAAPSSLPTESALPPPPAYTQPAPGGGGSRGRRARNDGSDVPSYSSRRGSGDSAGARDGGARRAGSNPTGGSHRGGGGNAAVTNQNGERVDVGRNGQGGGGGGGGSGRRVVHRVGMDCLSPINVSRAEGASSGVITPLHSGKSGLSCTTSIGPAQYMREEMLTPSPPPNWGQHFATTTEREPGEMEFKDEEERARAAMTDREADLELGDSGWCEVRKTRYINYITVTLTHVLIFLVLGTRGYTIVRDTLSDGYYLRCVAFLYYLPAYVFMLFSIDYLLAQFIYALGPIAHMQENSKYFSSKPCPRPAVMPRVTIQMPVYKENLVETILPSIQSVMTAVLHYKKMGGEANLYINDDGLQVISEKERNARVFAYKRHGVSYVARPPASIRPRKGLFKKASNLNYGLNVAIRVEEIMAESGGQVTDPVEALQLVSGEFNDEFFAGGDVRIGDIVLLVDSDTRVPEDCLSKSSGEFERYPQVGFMQCKTTSIRIHNNFWENMIARFTNDVYSVGIAMAVSSGDPAPLVGHNAFLRWSAIREVSWVDSKDGERKFWSEAHVSEDFDLALRLQARGYIGRYCTYTGEGFQEGVSLTAADEVIRLRKYAYGSCEIMLNKFTKWPCSGPITSMFWRYLLAGGVPFPAKIRMIAYLCTYISMAFAFYGIVGYLAVWIVLPAALKFLVNPFDILITVCFVFGGCSVFGVGMITYRNGYSRRASLLRSFLDQLVNAPIMLLFFSHVLWHLTVVCFRYFFGMTVEWSASVKEVSQNDFWTEVVNTFRRYGRTFLMMMLLAGLFVGVMWYFEVGWDIRVYLPTFIYIGSHILGPFLLNPVIMRGYY
ncbi:conserved unknown protein [Ectocarpus siliculosus]|uniref:Glycosyltransferase 2-like domain-containing protein n=1 Tax=Ectocarpus siliculosus TaxID=2880 RepID=D7G567_ECTSI|nr:conserved unknown protein [Ectocarpus siliculosus]|eukprot:CBJ27221.1 conserved unknown protein [Ectocarpus siliculosus]